jgi:hypothetical protein
VLLFRDDAFHDYFANPVYLDMVSGKFGEETRRHIEQMTATRLRRALLEQGNTGGLRTPSPSGPDTAFNILSAS